MDGVDEPKSPPNVSFDVPFEEHEVSLTSISHIRRQSFHSLDDADTSDAGSQVSQEDDEEEWEFFEKEFYELGFDEIERACEEAEESGCLKKRAKAYELFSKKSFHNGDYREAKKFSEKWLQVVQEDTELGDEQKHQMGRAYNNLAHACDKCGDYKSAMNYYEKDIEIARERGDVEGEACTLYAFGLLYHGIGNNQKAMQYLKLSSQKSQECEDKWTEWDSCCLMGELHEGWKEYEQAREFKEKCLKLAEEMVAEAGADEEAEQGEAVYEVELKASSLQNLGKLYETMYSDETLGTPEAERGELIVKALELYKGAHRAFETIEDERGAALALSNIGSAELQQGQVASALEKYKRCLEACEKHGNRQDMAESYGNMGEAYLRMGNPAEAMRFFLLDLSLAKGATAGDDADNGDDSPDGWHNEVRIIKNIAKVQFSSPEELKSGEGEWVQFQSKLPDQYPGLLHLAAKHGQLDLVKQLCAEKGQPLYDPDGELPDYTTPFEQSMIHGHQGVARYLLIHVKVRPFVHPSVADRLAAEHAPLGDAKDPATSYHSSAWSGDPIDPEDWDHSSEDRFGRSCLHIAVYKLHKDIIRALLEGGADCTKRDAKKWNAMHWLCASTKTVASREAHAEFLASSLGEWWRAVRGGALRGLRKGSASSVFRATEDAARQCEIAEMLWGAPGGRALCEQRDEDGLLPIHYCKNTYFVQWLKEHGPSLTHDARAYFLPRMLLFLLLSLPFGTVPLVVICINAVVSRSLRLGQALCGKGVAVFRTPLTLVVVLVAMLAMFTLPFLAFGLDSVADALWLPFSQMAVMILFMGVLAGKMTMERKYFYVRHPHDSVQQLNLANLFPLVGVCTDYFGLAQYQFEPTGLNDVDIGLSFLFDVDLRPYLDIMWFVTSMSAIIAWFLLASYIALALMVYSVRVDKLTQHRLSQSTTVLDVLERYPGYYGSAQRRMSGVTERLPGLFPFVSPNLNLLMSSLVTLLSDVAFVVIMRVTAFVMTCTTRLSMDCWDRARSPGRYLGGAMLLGTYYVITSSVFSLYFLEPRNDAAELRQHPLFIVAAKFVKLTGLFVSIFWRERLWVTLPVLLAANVALCALTYVLRPFRDIRWANFFRMFAHAAAALSVVVSMIAQATYNSGHNYAPMAIFVFVHGLLLFATLYCYHETDVMSPPIALDRVTVDLRGIGEQPDDGLEGSTAYPSERTLTSTARSETARSGGTLRSDPSARHTSFWSRISTRRRSRSSSAEGTLRGRKSGLFGGLSPRSDASDSPRDSPIDALRSSFRSAGTKLRSKSSKSMSRLRSPSESPRSTETVGSDSTRTRHPSDSDGSGAQLLQPPRRRPSAPRGSRRASRSSITSLAVEPKSPHQPESAWYERHRVSYSGPSGTRRRSSSSGGTRRRSRARDDGTAEAGPPGIRDRVRARLGSDGDSPPAFSLAVPADEEGGLESYTFGAPPSSSFATSRGQHSTRRSLRELLHGQSTRRGSHAQSPASSPRKSFRTPRDESPEALDPHQSGLRRAFTRARSVFGSPRGSPRGSPPPQSPGPPSREPLAEAELSLWSDYPGRQFTADVPEATLRPVPSRRAPARDPRVGPADEAAMGKPDEGLWGSTDALSEAAEATSVISEGSTTSPPASFRRS